MRGALPALLPVTVRLQPWLLPPPSAPLVAAAFTLRAAGGHCLRLPRRRLDLGESMGRGVPAVAAVSAPPTVAAASTSLRHR